MGWLSKKSQPIPYYFDNWPQFNFWRMKRTDCCTCSFWTAPLYMNGIEIHDGWLWIHRARKRASWQGEQHRIITSRVEIEGKGETSLKKRQCQDAHQWKDDPLPCLFTRSRYIWWPTRSSSLLVHCHRQPQKWIPFTWPCSLIDSKYNSQTQQHKTPYIFSPPFHIVSYEAPSSVKGYRIN